MKKVLLKAVLWTAGMYVSLALVQSCKNKKSSEGKHEVKVAIHPVEFPQDVWIEGFKFPEDSATIYGWLTVQYDSAAIISHAWGIWAGLTKPSGEMYKGQEILVYETWLGPTDLAAMTKAQNKNGACEALKDYRARLEFPHQLKHSVVAETIDTSTNSNFFVAVAYDPNAACYATNHLIFNQSQLDTYKVKDKIGKIPAFPQKSITTKPTYFIGKVSDNLIRIPSWPGTPNPVASDPFNVWEVYVYADVTNNQPPGKILVPVKGDHPTKAQIAAATCNLKDFINFKIDSATAAYINKQEVKQAGPVVAGDLALLVAMHVATKEISNWTWQTFFWSANPDQPYAPSSAMAASLRPEVIKGAAAHYAVSTAYAMVWPNQPITGGTNKNVIPMIGYNPYLEAVFGPSTFELVPNAMNASFQYGVQTNCMSCHALAQYDPARTINAQNNIPAYSTDQYIDMADQKLFANKVQLDFAWSIIANIDSIPKK